MAHIHNGAILQAPTKIAMCQVTEFPSLNATSASQMADFSAIPVAQFGRGGQTPSGHLTNRYRAIAPIVPLPATSTKQD
jgi:hypothetical protein